MKKYVLSLSLMLLSGAAFGQTITYSGSLRVRVEGWDWFKPASGSFQNAYTFTGATLRYGATRTTKRDEATLELAAPLLVGLPERATAPAPQGGLGLGSLYRAMNGSQNGSVFLKQAYWKDKNLGFRLGRFEFSEGVEPTSADPKLAAIKKSRVSERLIGPFAWTHIGRSFDGVHYSRTSGGYNVSAVVAYPTQGVFDLNGQPTLTEVRFGYLAATQSSKTKDRRLFLIGYEDTRKGSAKVDNQTLTIPDTGAVRITTLGGHWLQAQGEWNYLAWAAYQSGDWGSQSHQAHAYALEAGFSPKGNANNVSYRLGYDVYSGDNDAADGTHGTFYPLLNTPRIYARTPFFGESNLKDTFFSVQGKPDKKTTIRADYHLLSLDKATDRWYAAGGPFVARGNFGLIGRANPSNDSRLGDLLDISVDRALNSNTSATLYLGQMFGKKVIQGIYPDKNGLLLYGELNYKF